MHNAEPSEPVDLYICTTCRESGADRADERPGERLHQNMVSELSGHACRSAIRLHPVECMSVCSRPCTVAVSSPSKWTYIIGGLDPVSGTQALMDYITVYAASPSGTPPLKERPTAIRKGTIARFPPRNA